MQLESCRVRIARDETLSDADADADAEVFHEIPAARARIHEVAAATRARPPARRQSAATERARPAGRDQCSQVCRCAL